MYDCNYYIKHQFHLSIVRLYIFFSFPLATLPNTLIFIHFTFFLFYCRQQIVSIYFFKLGFPQKVRFYTLEITQNNILLYTRMFNLSYNLFIRVPSYFLVFNKEKVHLLYAEDRKKTYMCNFLTCELCKDSWITIKIGNKNISVYMTVTQGKCHP